MMDCTDSMAPNDEELLRFILDEEDDGALEEGWREHLEHCTICQRRHARYQSLNTSLLMGLYRRQCPDTMKISDFCAHLLAPDEALAITMHLHICPLCAQEAVETRRFYANLALSDPLPSLASQPILRRILATLIPWQPQLVTRNSQTHSGSNADDLSWPRQYRTETVNFSLHLSRNSQGEIMLLGLFTSIDPHESIDDFAGIRIALHVDKKMPSVSPLDQRAYGAPLLITEVDDLGHLVFEAVPSGNYTMIVHMPDREIVVEGLTIERE